MKAFLFFVSLILTSTIASAAPLSYKVISSDCYNGKGVAPHLTVNEIISVDRADNGLIFIDPTGSKITYPNRRIIHQIAGGPGGQMMEEGVYFDGRTGFKYSTVYFNKQGQGGTIDSLEFSFTAEAATITNTNYYGQSLVCELQAL